MAGPASMIKGMVQRTLGRAGYMLVKYRTPAAGFGSAPSDADVQATYAPDMEPQFREMHAACRDYSMTPADRMYVLYSAMKHVVGRRIPGDIVECGVWRGGSIMLCAHILKSAGDTQRKLWLYDTFTGMVEPTARDVSSGGLTTKAIWDASKRDGHNEWCYASLDDVKRNVQSTGLAPDRFEFVQGKVEDTLGRTRPPRIALLRLDTDWYESTKHELTHLYPLLSPGGVILVDDYGQWQGQREAVDEYFAKLPNPPLLTRIDHSSRLGVKPHEVAP